jgi:pimeloyl-ACP methyl ester carboxylesterase
LFVSPIGYGLLSWQPILERLCQEYRIVTIDLRGTGRSDPIVRPYTEVDHALDIAAVVRACGFQPLTGIGISAAANMLIRAAADDPTLFKRFVFVGPTSGLSLLPGQAPMREEEDIVEAFVQGNLERAFRLFTPTLISEPGTEELIEQRVQGYLRLPKETALSFFVDPAPPEDEIVKLLPSIRVAVLLMHGTADKNTPFAASRQLVKALPYAQLYPFEGRCHLPMVTATQEFCDVLRTFLNTGQVPAPRQAEIVIESTP